MREKERPQFAEPVQSATVVGAAYGIHRTTLTQAARAGVLGKSAYRSGDAWLMKTDHPDFAEWLRVHEVQPRSNVRRRKRVAEREDEGGVGGDAHGTGGVGGLFDVMGEERENLEPSDPCDPSESWHGQEETEEAQEEPGEPDGLRG